MLINGTDRSDWSAAPPSQDNSGAGLPQISLPKGGGAIRGIGEKFAANPVSGTGVSTVPIYVSPGRSAFTPELELSYNSGSGNSPFGFGWSVSVPQITRKTDKGLPQYEDARESDVFILPGTEDLMPALVQSGGKWQRDITSTRSLYGKQYEIHRYRPRVDSLFARIERWINVSDPADTFWRSISKINITSWYGKTAESRILDPADTSRVFTWLISESYDDKGNVASYAYKQEGSEGVDLTQVHERNRTDATRSANRYIKQVSYGNRTPYFPDLISASEMPLPTDWCFELVFDYGEHDLLNPLPQDKGAWICRPDPFSSYRATFEIRTYRLCQRVLMFHNFPEDKNVGLNCLVRSTDLAHSSAAPTDPSQPFYSYLLSVTQTSYRRSGTNSYFSDSLPPVEFEYAQAVLDETVREAGPDSLSNLPFGVDGSSYRWADLDGEGLAGILTEQAGSWFYKANLSPVNQRMISGQQYTLPWFAPVELVARQPSGAALNRGHQQLYSISGDGQLDLVDFEGPNSGYYERTDAANWEPFVPFQSLPSLDWRDPQLKFVDLTGDGFADLLVSEGDSFWWYKSLSTLGFASGEKVPSALDEEAGPKIVFADSTGTIFLADMSGDGLSDIVRIRNGEVCYWPNLGYGNFGAKITMDHAPLFDRADLFDGRHIRLADIDGSGTNDIVYFAGDSVRLYFNQSGNGWGTAHVLNHFPTVDAACSTAVVDLLGNGTACLVWSSTLPGNARQPLRYIHLMGGQKPHLLVQQSNNLGTTTVVRYAPSTKFYVADKLAGTPWVTRLPFPVQVVEQVETYDYISRNVLVTRYAYHHGYYDGVEREFRGFGCVDQYDTGEFPTLRNSPDLPDPTNLDASSNIPPVHTKTWFHTGAYFGEASVSRYMEREYYSEGDTSEAIADLSQVQLQSMLLDDTPLPSRILLPDGSQVSYDPSPEELREACRALRGSVLRQEVYGLDNTEESDRPYSVSEYNHTIEMVQPQGPNQYGSFFVHPRESIEFQYERRLYKVVGNTIADASAPPPARTAADPRVSHAFTLAVDRFGNVLQSASVTYGRRYMDPALTPADQGVQSAILSTYAENKYTNALDLADSNRAPLTAESRTYELIQAMPAANQPDLTNLFRFDEMLAIAQGLDNGLHDILFENVSPSGLVPGQPYRRLLGTTRIYYRPDDMGAAASNPKALLPFGSLESLALPGTTYKLAFTPGLLSQVYQRGGSALLPTPASVLGSVAADGGGYVDLDSDGHWWIPGGRTYYLPGAPATPQEKSVALQHFFMPRRFEDPFSDASTLDYDADSLLVVKTTDSLNNTVAATNDYRVLAPILITDPNGNRAAVSFDTLGMVAGTAVMGKTTESVGDSLSGFTADLTQTQIDAFYGAADPHTQANALLGSATTRIVYDVNRFFNSRMSAPNDPSQWQPVFSATLARKTHVSDLTGGQSTTIQISFGFADGFSREIQKKIQSEPGPVVDKGPTVNPRWVGSGWTIFNNKGKPVRQYEPFFSQLAKGHQFEFGVQVGVSPILCYDPVQRVVATLLPNRTYEKVVFDVWHEQTWDVNDTVLQSDPTTDPDVGDFFQLLPTSDYSPTWYTQRAGGGLGAQEQDAATKAAAHANTPATAYVDTLGRPFLTIADNGGSGKYPSRVDLDIQGNQRSVRDAIVQAGDQQGRIVMRYDYDMLKNRIHQASMEAGERWTLHDCTGKPIRGWDARGHNLRTEYDILRRPTALFVLGTDSSNSDPRTTFGEILVEETTYGESQASPEVLNLRTRIFQHADTAGIVSSTGKNPITKEDEGFDFKGNQLRTSRSLVADYKALPNWSSAPATVETFMSSMQYDAMNRPIGLTMPDNSVIRPTYNEANLLETVNVNLRGAASATPFVTNVDYNAKGQRVLIEHGNNTATTYSYDPSTFRLLRITTTRTSFPTNQQTVQDLSYVYDPIGNIAHIQDNADIQNVVFFKNRRVEPSNDYTYDAIYRLIQATGREQLGLDGGGTPQSPWATSYDDVPRVNLPHPGDGNAMGTYTEQYQYDAVGNFVKYIHQGANPANPGWTRSYTYNEASLLETGKESNRLTSTVVSGNQPLNEPYTYDLHGSMTSMPQLQAMQWDYKDELHMTQRQAVNTGDTDGTAHQGERTYYVYSADGQRVRKTTESAAGKKLKERLYLGGFELYREFDSAGNVTLARETLHVMDDKKRVALVETKTIDVSAPPSSMPSSATRYQFDNHLGTACLELDDTGNVITYEEYYPYGSTSYQAGRSLAEVSLKRYRYTGKERDEENGFTYHGARYYAEWLGRWTSCDPAGFADGLNLYISIKCNPVCFVDKSGRASVAAPASVVDIPPPPPPPPPPPRVIQNQTRGLADAAALKALVESKGHGVQSEVTVKGGRGGSRVDIAPDPKAAQTIAKTMESKSIDLDTFRTDQGALDLPRLRAAVRDDLKQVLKHEAALQRGVKADLPSRESLEYTLHNAKPGEADQFQTLARAEAAALPKFTPVDPTLKVGVLQNSEGSLSTASGRPLTTPPANTSVSNETKASSTGSPEASEVAAVTHEVPMIAKVTGVVGGIFHVINLYAAYQEIKTLSRGEDLYPNGYYDYGLGGRIITDFDKLPEGFSSSVIMAPNGYGPGFYEKKNGVIYKNGKATGAGGA